MNREQEAKNAEWIRNTTEQLTPKRVGKWKSGKSCCPNCKRGVSREDNFCSYCGQSLDWSWDC